MNESSVRAHRTMENLHRRKKQPDVVRRNLLDCAARLAAEHGLASLTIQAVSDAAGVTKGGLLHHFPNKQALVEAVFFDLLEQLDHDIDTRMAADPESRGRFTRAYLGACFFDRPDADERRIWSALSVTSITDPMMRRLWSQWLEARLERHRETDTGLVFDMVRLAADGIWLAYVVEAEHKVSTDLPSLRARLIAMTRDG
ncbi:TetR/AcrR family transcriptional regulator [Bradyrhizobium sp. LHD-71]|uniref:TetR/AcrR family transcriptional regulator n=1 Tax=Bradyrhizobium sp. LHD-71 TaxID=3072141 RepID=UPI00280D681F|nr:TetR/AcrR family transcriptional regulator [Bradyrhizobium sp. LHD-71]MDQ8730234.1 TetR/AcrR family transcriptional regulator [Bradyrhizobium sp. LHD-71]